LRCVKAEISTLIRKYIYPIFIKGINTQLYLPIFLIFRKADSFNGLPPIFSFPLQKKTALDQQIQSDVRGDQYLQKKAFSPPRL